MLPRTVLLFIWIASSYLSHSFVYQLPKDLSSSEEVQREHEEDGNIVLKSCNNFDHYAPCSCVEVITSTKVHKGGKTMVVEFPEYKCDEEGNSRRGRIAPGYQCHQLTGYRTLYRDHNNNPIKVGIKYIAGCELRCINRYCQMPLPVPAVLVAESGE